jgi:hypothetical protein
MNSTSLATSGVAGAVVIIACWVVSACWALVLPDQVVAALLTLSVAATHAVCLLSRWFGPRAAPDKAP